METITMTTTAILGKKQTKNENKKPFNYNQTTQQWWWWCWKDGDGVGTINQSSSTRNKQFINRHMRPVLL